MKSIVQISLKKKTFGEIKELFNGDLKHLGVGPNKKKPNDNGLFECITQKDKTNKVRNISELIDMENTNSWGFKGFANHYRIFPCYMDTNNKNTLEWWLVYYIK